uniref:Glycine rich superfamily member n=1 Tax=Rhipicephalus appendiculatus TaxID=34631 RepID=A0A131Z2G3_RHIAP
MKTFVVACLLSAATLANARDDRRLGSNLGAVGGINGVLRAGVDQAGPRGAPGYTASIGAGVGARLGGQGSLGLGGYGQGFPGLYGSSWGGAYGASPYNGYAPYGAPYGSGRYGFNPHGHYGSYGAYHPYGGHGGYGGYGGAYGYHGENGASYGWGVPSYGTRSPAAQPRARGDSVA